MGRVRRIFETIAGQLRPLEVVRRHGFTILFYACALLVVHLSRATFELRDFDEREWNAPRRIVGPSSIN